MGWILKLMLKDVFNFTICTICDGHTRYIQNILLRQIYCKFDNVEMWDLFNSRQSK